MGKAHKRAETETDTREKLLRASAHVFAEKGFGGATVKAIADEAGCNISLISYHFDGKEGLFKALVERFGRERLRDAENVLYPPESMEDMRARLRLWMQQFLLCQVQEDHLCDILNRENILGEEFLWDVFQETFLKAFHAIVKFFEAARKKGLIRKDVDPISATTMLFGSLNHVGRHQKIQQKVYRVSIAQEKYRAQVIEQFLNIIISGISGGNA